jgi:hypothetical protein
MRQSKLAELADDVRDRAADLARFLAQADTLPAGPIVRLSLALPMASIELDGTRRK